MTHFKTNLKNDLRGIVRREMVAYFRALTTRKKNLPRNKFIIFTQGRTGSNLLRTLLDSHPDIACIGEPFVRWYIKVFFPKLHIQGQLASCPKPVCGLLLHDMHLDFQKIEYQDILSYLHNKGWKIVHLRRRNLLKQIISGRFAFSNRQWHYKSDIDVDVESLKSVHIDAAEMLKLLEERETRYLKQGEIMAQIPHLELIFEDDLSKTEQHQKTVDKICDYLGIPSAPVNTPLVKTPLKTRDLLQNYEEIVALLKDTKYAPFLEGLKG